MDSIRVNKKNTEIPDTELDCWDYTKEPLQISECHGSARSTGMVLLTIKWDDLVEQFRKPELGPKDGRYICRCAFSDNHRHDVSHLPGYLLILDGDSSYVPETGEAATGAPDPHAVHEFLHEQNITHLIYSSHSNQQDSKGHRYRILIPVYLEGQEDLDACVAWLVDRIQAGGIPLADVKENHTFAQAWYRPRVPNEKAREAFVILEHDGPQPFPLQEAREWYRGQQNLCQSVETADQKTPVREMNADSPIAQFNAKVKMRGITKMLTAAGYLKRGESTVNGKPARRFLHPESTSGEAGVVVFESKAGILRTHSHHGDYDRLSGRTEDAFGVFMLLRHDGDFDSAFQEIQD